MYSKLGLLVLLLCIFVDRKSALRESIDEGFGEHIRWFPTLEEGLQAAQAEMKPIMLIVHRSWCPACRRLKPSLRTSQEFAQLSNFFIMVNLEDESDAETANLFQPDGGYVPRILFLDWSGGVREEFFNRWGNPKYKYYHSDASTVTLVMKQVINYFVPIASYYRGQHINQLGEL